MGTNNNQETNKNSQSNNATYEFNMSLLQEQVKNIMLFFSSDMLSYYATLESIAFVELKHQNDESTEGLDSSLVYTADMTLIQSILFGIIARYNIMQISFSRYYELYNRYLNGEVDYSLQPNIDINIANIFAMLSNLYFYKGALGILERDIQQPVYGV